MSKTHHWTQTYGRCRHFRKVSEMKVLFQTRDFKKTESFRHRDIRFNAHFPSEIPLCSSNPKLNSSSRRLSSICNVRDSPHGENQFPVPHCSWRLTLRGCLTEFQHSPSIERSLLYSKKSTAQFPAPENRQSSDLINIINMYNKMYTNGEEKRYDKRGGWFIVSAVPRLRQLKGRHSGEGPWTKCSQLDGGRENSELNKEVDANIEFYTRAG